MLYQQEGEPFLPGMTPLTNTPQRLFEFLETEVTSPAMIIPHLHYLVAFQEPGAEIGVLKMEDLVSELIRNVEIYSMHGSAEHPGCLRSQSGALARGRIPRVNEVLDHILKGTLRLGFVGDTDSHTGNPGSSKWLRNRVQYSGGITGVYAPRLRREDIWEAIWNHRTLATTGARMIVDFHLNNVFMGQSLYLPSPKEHRSLSVRVIGTDVIERVAIVRRGKEVYRQEVASDSTNLEWKDTEELASSTYYYARIEQRDGHIGWTSPVWVELKG